MIAACAASICSVLILHILIGYPLWLHWRARRRGCPFPSRKRGYRATILLPVRNGAAFLAAKLDSLLAQNYDPSLVDILVVSDGSTDGSDAIAERYADRGVRLLRVDPPVGKAAALNAALPAISAAVVVLTDVRQALHPDCLRYITAAFEESGVGVVSGDLVILDGATRSEADVGLYRRYESWIRDNLSRIDSMLGATGCLYAIRRELVVPYPARIILDDMFQPLRVLLRGYRVVIERRALAFDFPTSLDMEFSRKVRTQAGIYQLVGCIPSLLGFRNRLWVAFWSLKMGRLFLPHILLLTLLAGFFLPAPWRILLLSGHGLLGDALRSPGLRWWRAADGWREEDFFQHLNATAGGVAIPKLR